MCWDENNFHYGVTHYKWQQVFLAAMQNIAVTDRRWCEDSEHQQCMNWASSSCTAQLYLGALLRSAVTKCLFKEDAGSASEQQQSPWYHQVLWPWCPFPLGCCRETAAAALPAARFPHSNFYCLSVGWSAARQTVLIKTNRKLKLPFRTAAEQQICLRANQICGGTRFLLELGVWVSPCVTTRLYVPLLRKKRKQAFVVYPKIFYILFNKFDEFKQLAAIMQELEEQTLYFYQNSILIHLQYVVVIRINGIYFWKC